LLENVYTNRFGDLKTGRVRYGVVCDDSGVILDDGTFCRLADDHFYITTTSGNAEGMAEWLTWWSAPSGPGQEIDVHVTNLTAGLSAVNVAGPRAREVVQPLIDLDLSPAAFPYLAAGRGHVAGVPALLLRIGFVGELGYEIHCPAEYGEHVWDALMESGAPFGIRPFGVEAQRVLRLHKKHLIVGHDTDALSTPLEAEMAWIVKFEKEGFVGRPSLERLAERGGQQQLVGFRMEDPHHVPPEGAAVVRAGRGIGRVTSSRYSPVLHQAIGLAWVPAEVARPGEPLLIASDGAVAAARVVTEPFYDPAGERLRA
jgi:sarcosine oxidase subunit alpha